MTSANARYPSQMPDSPILQQMLDRLYASLMRGPNLNCRPHASRQRVDVARLAAFRDPRIERDGARTILTEVLDRSQSVRIDARVDMPPWMAASRTRFGAPPPPAPAVSDEVRAERAAAEEAWIAQRKVLTRLRNLGEDAKTYEQDTGVHALSVGFPLLSLPPGTTGGTRRILAPIAFVPISLAVRTGQRRGIDIARRGEGVDLVTPNVALLAWLEREGGDAVDVLFEDEEGADPWREVRELIDLVVARIHLEDVDPHALLNPATALMPIPKADGLPVGPSVLPSAVLGLFPAANQGLIRDTKAMLAGEALQGPVESFLHASVSIATDDKPAPAETAPETDDDVFLVARADPFQHRAVRQARQSKGLVVHGPPGTGKSQTIANIIGDHLARGERVLFVCDKRTALDVVANRLEHMGLGALCAVVHDPKRDQRPLYMGVRAALDALPDVQTNDRATARLKTLRRKRDAHHDELGRLQASLAERFHEPCGQWLSLQAPDVPALREVPLSRDALQTHEQRIQVLLERAASVTYATNPWVGAVGVSLDTFLARSQAQTREKLASCVTEAQAVDATCDERIPPFRTDDALAAQGEARSTLARLLPPALATDATWREALASLPAEAIRRRQNELDGLAEARALLQNPADRALALSRPAEHDTLTEVQTALHDLNGYLRSTKRWWGLLAFGARRRAARVLRPYGLDRTPEDAQRVYTFLRRCRAQWVLHDFVQHITPPAQRGAEPGPHLTADADAIASVLAPLAHAHATHEQVDGVRAVLRGTQDAAPLVDGLDASAARAKAIATWESSLQGLGLCNGAWLADRRAAVREGHLAQPVVTALLDSYDTLADVLRVQADVATLDENTRAAVESVLSEHLTPAQAQAALTRRALAVTLAATLAEDEPLRRLDGRLVEAAIDEMARLQAKERKAVREHVHHLWTERQRERLLAGTRTRLNSEGAALRRRLFVRGRRSMRLRQMIASGATDDPRGDPLFDMCPIWMASPETVAQVFPRTPLFDVVVFDEASQCRLEEALPVLTRAHRAVIAGDPKQLPPTRFFEAAITVSEDTELETDQDLFEAQQTEVEDLLAAALNLDIEEAYLDVHYRSRNADLIEFSNDNFYGQRLQALPGHPSHRARTPPLTLERVDGTYDARCNPKEAERVIEIIRTLLDEKSPPSIGVACFNLTQRNVIRDLLDEHAAEDEAFAAKLLAATELQGEGSFEGLFVKNLESVQGDERDHVIISTTYGPNPEGKFYRRFGPLTMAGGGRRLNVLVTRARERVHLVTSIPPSAYATPAPVPAGQAPSGTWLLFAYLRFAEQLRAQYEDENERHDTATQRTHAQVVERRIAPFSSVAKALGERLARDRNLGSDVHWGNEGFCIDVALHHPDRFGDVSGGILCDIARYPSAPDPIDWEVYRTEILRNLGWTLHRVWTPDLFRDTRRVINTLAPGSPTAGPPSGPPTTA